jgi:FkbM family methyltransferase
MRSRTPDRLPAEIIAQQALVGEPRVIFDVGAGDGETVALYRRAFPNALIYAFEPTSETADILRGRFDESVVVVDAALGSTVGIGSLRVNQFQPTTSLLPTASAGPTFWGEGLLETQAVVNVPLTTVDAFCAERNIAFVDLMKIDVQGGELSVLEGARQLLERRRVGAVYFEVLMVETYDGQASFRYYLALLDAFGYVPAGVYGQVIREGRLLSLNLLARPEPMTTNATAGSAHGA